MALVAHCLYIVINHMQVACDDFMLHCMVPTFHTILQLVILCKNMLKKPHCAFTHFTNYCKIHDQKSRCWYTNWKVSQHDLTTVSWVLQKLCACLDNWKGRRHGITTIEMYACLDNYSKTALTCTAYIGRKMWRCSNMRSYTNSIFSPF